MILRGLTARPKDVEAVSQCQRNQCDCGEMPVVIAEPVGDGTADASHHVQPNALALPTGLGRLVQEVRDKTGKNHDRDPIVNGLHS